MSSTLTTTLPAVKAPASRHYVVLCYLFALISSLPTYDPVIYALNLVNVRLMAASITMWVIKDAQRRNRPLIRLMEEFFFSAV
jgi:hypothetical protein